LPVNRRSPKGVPIYGKSVIRAIAGNQRCAAVKELRERCCWCGAKLSAAEKLDAAERRKAVLRCGGTADAAGLRCCGDRWAWISSLTQHPFDFQIKTLREVRLRASRSYGQVLRSADMEADSCDGTGDLRGESFERPMFSGVRGVNVARCHSWAAAKLDRRHRAYSSERPSPSVPSSSSSSAIQTAHSRSSLGADSWSA